MKLKEYIKQLRRLEKEVGNVELIYGTDNYWHDWYRPVKAYPCILKIDKEDLNRDRIYSSDVYNKNDKDGDTIVVCIN